MCGPKGGESTLLGDGENVAKASAMIQTKSVAEPRNLKSKHTIVNAITVKKLEENTLIWN